MMSPPAPRPPLDLSGGSNASHRVSQQQQASSPLAAPPISASSSGTSGPGPGTMFARAQTSRTAYAAPSTPAGDSFAALLGAESPGTFLHNLTAAAASMPVASPSTAQPPALHRGASSQSLMNPPRAPSRASSKVGSQTGGSRSNTPRGNTASASDDEEEEDGSSPLDDDEEEEDEDEDMEDDLQQKPPSHWPLDPSMLGLPFVATPAPPGTPAAAPQAGTTPGGSTADAPTPGVAELDQIIGHLINYIGTTAPSSWDTANGGAPAASPSAAQMQEQVRTRRSTASGAAASSSSGTGTGRSGKAAPVHPVVLANLIARINGQPIAGELPPMSELDPAVVLQGLLEWREQRHEQHRGSASAANSGGASGSAASSSAAPNAAASKHFNTWAHDQAKLQREQAEQQAVFDQQLRQVVSNKEAADASAAAMGFDAAAFSFANFDFGENDDVDEDPDFDPEAWTRAFGSSPVSILTPLPGFTPHAHGGTPVMQQQQQQLQQQQQHAQTGHGLLTPSQLQGHTNIASLQRGSLSDAGTPYGGALDGSMPPPAQQQQRADAHRALSLGGASPADAMSPLVWGNAQVDLGGGGAQQPQQMQQQQRTNAPGPSGGARREERERERGAESSRRSSGESQGRREESRREDTRREDRREDSRREESRREDARGNARTAQSSSRRRSASPPRSRHDEPSDSEDADSSPSKLPSFKGKGKPSSSSHFNSSTQRDGGSGGHERERERKVGRPAVEETAEEKEARRKAQNRLNSARSRARQRERAQQAQAQGHAPASGSGAKAKAKGGAASGENAQLLSENRFLRDEVERLRDENAQLRADLALGMRLRTTAPPLPLPRGGTAAPGRSGRERSTAGRSRREEREWDDARRAGGSGAYDAGPSERASAAASSNRWARGGSRYPEDDEDSVGSYDRHDSDLDDADLDRSRGLERGHGHDDDARSYCSALEYSDEARPRAHRGGSKRSGGGRRAASPESGRPAKRARPRTGGGGGNELDILVQAAEASYRQHPQHQQNYRA